jgi:Flp pilus assembly protein TadG
MVEFALVVPILVALIFGIFEFGEAYNTQIALQAAAREGARELALGTPESEVVTTVEEAAPSVGDIDVDPDPCPSDGNGEATVKVTAAVEIGILFLNTDQTLEATGVMRCGL